ncbi:hypothetical protein STANM309S_06530 [Streptomyces tanashiensis]
MRHFDAGGKAKNTRTRVWQKGIDRHVTWGDAEAGHVVAVRPISGARPQSGTCQADFPLNGKGVFPCCVDNSRRRGSIAPQGAIPIHPRLTRGRHVTVRHLGSRLRSRRGSVHARPAAAPAAAPAGATAMVAAPASRRGRSGPGAVRRDRAPPARRGSVGAGAGAGRCPAAGGHGHRLSLHEAREARREALEAVRASRTRGEEPQGGEGHRLRRRVRRRVPRRLRSGRGAVGHGQLEGVLPDFGGAAERGPAPLWTSVWSAWRRPVPPPTARSRPGRPCPPSPV